MSEKPTVAVIMSTYNGEKYLAEQLDSILAQEGVHVELFIRDDGSKDSTRDILLSYAERYANVHLDFGENLGFARSFLTELAAASGFEYYAFSDQDDYWKKEKLITAVKAIKAEEAIHLTKIPIIWHSNLHVSDSKLNIIRTTELHKRVHSLESLILRRSIPGCSMVMNKEAAELSRHKYISLLIPTRGHDICIMYLTYLMGGKMICSSDAYIYYRQHGNNTVGTTLSLWARLVREYGRLFKWGHGIEAGAAQGILQEGTDGILPEAKRTLELVAGHKDKWLYRLMIIFSPRFRTGDVRLTLWAKTRALFGWL